MTTTPTPTPETVTVTLCDGTVLWLDPYPWESVCPPCGTLYVVQPDGKRKPLDEDSAGAILTTLLAQSQRIAELEQENERLKRERNMFLLDMRAMVRAVHQGKPAPPESEWWKRKAWEAMQLLAPPLTPAPADGQEDENAL